jgi:hypothetical protein
MTHGRNVFVRLQVRDNDYVFRSGSLLEDEIGKHCEMRSFIFCTPTLHHIGLLLGRLDGRDMCRCAQL